MANKQATKTKLQSYIRASAGSAQHAQNVANYSGDLAAARKIVAKRNAGQQRAQTRLTRLGEDASSAITDAGDRRKYNSLRAMQSDRLAKAKKSKDLVRAGHEQMAQQHGDAAETILDKYRKEGTDMCNVCGQTPCNCTHITEGSVDDHIKKVVNIYSKHRSLEDRASYKGDKVARAKHKEGAKRASDMLAKMRAKQSAANADKPKPVEVHHDYSAAIAKDYKDQEARRGIGHVRDSVELEGNMVEANSMNPGISAKRTTLIQRAIRRAQKTPQEKAMVGESTNPYIGLVDEAKEASYDGNYQDAVLRFREKAKKQEQERGPVDIQKLAARLRAVKLPPEGNKK